MVIALIVALMVISVEPVLAKRPSPTYDTGLATLHIELTRWGVTAEVTVNYVIKGYRNNFVYLRYKVVQYTNADWVFIAFGIYDGGTVSMDPQTGEMLSGDLAYGDFQPISYEAFHFGVMTSWKPKYFYDQKSSVNFYDIKIQAVVSLLETYTASDWKIYQWYL